MSTDCINFKCTHCDYNSKWKCNVTRHMVRKHPASNVTPNAANVTPNASNVTPKASNVTPKASNVTLNSCDTNQCINCNKIFTRRQYLLNHIPKCKGATNTLTCEFCNMNFQFYSGKSRHLRICKVKKEIDSQALIVAPEPQSNASTSSSVNQVTQNANIINNNNTNNTTNNNLTVNNIMVFDPTHMELLNDHISKKEFTKLAFHHDFSKVLTDYSTALLRRSENQCVRKTNLRSTSSAVHVGNDKWEYHSDNQVLPKLLSNIADNFNDVKELYKVNIYKQLETFMIDVTCEATDCHEDAEEEARLKELYKRAVSNIKHLLFNLTKQTLLERKNKAVGGVACSSNDSSTTTVPIET